MNHDNDETDDVDGDDVEAMARIAKIYEQGKQFSATVQKVHVDGVQRTQGWLVAAVVEDVLKARSFGDAVNRAQEAKRKLDQLGIFKSVAVRIDTSKTPGSAADALDVLFTVEERRLVTGDVGVKIGNNEGTAETQVSLNNLLGLADRLKFVHRKSTAGASDYLVTLQKPLGADMDFPISFNVFQTRVENPFASHSVTYRGLSVESLAYSALGTHEFKYDVSWREIGHLAEKASFAVRQECGHSLKSSLSHTVTCDRRNEGTGAGWTAKAVTELAGLGLGDAQFIKNTLQTSVSTGSLNGFELALGFRAGYVHALQFGRKQASIIPAPAVRLCDRFFLGGALDVRGFPFKSLGPRQGADALGGAAFWAAAANIFAPLPTTRLRDLTGDAIRLHAFANAGSVASPALGADSLAAALEPLQSQVYAAAGLGLQVHAGAFRVEVNYCVPVWSPLNSTVDVTPKMQLGVGFEFL